jgi:hypothetical protein
MGMDAHDRWAPTFQDRMLKALGQGLSTLNKRLGLAETIAGVSSERNVEALNAIHERLDALEAAVHALTRYVGAVPPDGAKH